MLFCVDYVPSYNRINTFILLYFANSFKIPLSQYFDKELHVLVGGDLHMAIIAFSLKL